VGKFVMGEDGLCRRHYEPRTVCHASMRALSLLGARGVDDRRSGYYALATPSQNSEGR
jgi:hypothetical protein